MRPRFLDGITARENHERFVRRVVEHESVWTLWGNNGPLIAESTDYQPDDDEADLEWQPRDVYLFFSDEAYARRALRETWPDYPDARALEISLFDFLHRWLPGLHRDGHLTGTNWTGDLIGIEVEPDALAAELSALLSEEMLARHRQLRGMTPRPRIDN